MAARTSPARRRALFVAVPVFVLAVVAIGMRSMQVALYTAPPQRHETVDLPSKSSSIVVPITFSLAELQTEADTKAPVTLFSIDQDLNACVPAKWAEFCLLPRPWGGRAKEAKTIITPAIDCHISGTVTRGAFQVGGAGTGLTVSVPIAIRVSAKGRGEIGKHAQVDPSADSNANGLITFDVDENWNLRGTVKADYTWTDPPHVWILGIKVTFADKVDPKLHEMIAKLQAELPAALASLKLKERAADVWSKGFTSLQVNGAPPVWLTFAPESVGFGGYHVAQGDLSMSFMVSGRVATFLGPKPVTPSPTPLPQLMRVLPAPGFTFSVPLAASYDALRDQLRRALKVGQEQRVALPERGTVEVTINDVELYQTDDNALAIGLDLVATSSGHWLATRGMV